MHDPDICRHSNTQREWVIQFEFVGIGQTEKAALGDIEGTLNEASWQEATPISIARLLGENQIVLPGGPRSYCYCNDCGKTWTKEMPVTKEDVTANTQAHQLD